MNLGVLVFQMICTILWIIFGCFVTEASMDEVFANFKYLEWYKKVATILITPMAIFIYIWVLAFIWLGPEHYKTIMFI